MKGTLSSPAEPSSASGGTQKLKVAVVIPCYRVERHIGEVIRSIPPGYGPIVCVDDASTDGTATVIAAVADSRVVLLRHEVNRGVGGAMKTGYLEAIRLGAEFCVKMDGDGQMDAAYLDDLVAPLLDGTAEYAKGNRFVDQRALRSMPRTRLIGNALLSFASKLACGYWNMLDVNNGYTGVRSATLQRIDLEEVSDRYFFETSMLIELNILRAVTVDVEMPARYADESSSLRISTVLASFPFLLTRGLARRLYWRYLIHEFSVASVCLLLGIPLLLFGVGFGSWQWALSIRTGVTASAGTVLLAALPIILGFQLLLAATVLDVLSSVTHKRRPERGPTARAGG